MGRLAQTLGIIIPSRSTPASENTKYRRMSWLIKLQTKHWIALKIRKPNHCAILSASAQFESLLNNVFVEPTAVCLTRATSGTYRSGGKDEFQRVTRCPLHQTVLSIGPANLATVKHNNSAVLPNHSLNRTYCGGPAFGLQKPSPNTSPPQ